MILSIIIVNYNTYDLTCQCIESIYKETDNISFEIILVDNASKECDSSLFQERFPEVLLIRNDLNEGFGRANNKGMEVAKGDFILLLNSDTIIIDKAIENSVDFLKNTPADVGVMGCRQINGEGELIPSVFNGNYYYKTLLRRLNPFWFIEFRNSHLEESKGKSIKEVVGVSGAYMLMKRAVIDKTGMFDPDFFLYSEENEWFRNRISHFFKTLYNPFITIIHLEGKSDKSNGIMDKQKLVSFYLGWYKSGKLKYVLAVYVAFHQALIKLVLLPFMKKGNRIKELLIIKNLFLIIPYLIKIILYNNKYCSRKRPLKVSGL